MPGLDYYRDLTPQQRLREYVRLAWPAVVRALTDQTAGKVSPKPQGTPRLVEPTAEKVAKP